MDKFNVINRIDNLSDLEQDIFDWSRLPIKFKRMSDDECIRQHGMNNLQYYETIRSKLLNNAPLSDIYDDNLQEASEYSIFDQEIYDRKGHKERLMASRALQQSPYIILLDLEDYGAGIDNDNNKSNLRLVVDKYHKYLSLPIKYRRWCDYYSKDIYGLSVPDMFKALKNLGDENDEAHLESDPKDVDMDQVKTTMRDMANQAACENNIIDLLTFKSLNYVSLDESYRDHWVDDQFIDDAAELDFDTVFNKVTPYFTPDEYNRLAENYIVESLDYDEWKKGLREALKEGNEQKIIDYGWNPSVPFNEETQKFARDRQIAWFKEKAPRVVDITKLENQLIFEPIGETTKFMEDLYKEKNLFPVYIVMSYSDTLFGKVERVIKKVEYSHAGLCFDSSLKEIFTFSFGKEYNGFITDSLRTYINNSKKAIMSIICIFVDKDTRDKLYQSINYLQDHKEKTRYGFGNIINILMNRAKKFPYPENLSMVCSQFVDMMLKLVDIDLTGKSSNLVIPQDFQTIHRPEVYKVYEGLCIKYKESKVERLIKLLFLRNKIQNIKYSDQLPEPVSFLNKPLEEAYNGIVEEIRSLLEPKNIFESAVPFRFNDKGELEIELYPYLEEQYLQAHSLLESYDEENIEGIKKEVAHLFYINTMIEKKIRKMKKADVEYEAFITLRERVIEDFKTYIKVAEKDKDFNFAEYYENSSYNLNNKTWDSVSMKYSGKEIKAMKRKIENFKK